MQRFIDLGVLNKSSTDIDNQNRKHQQHWQCENKFNNRKPFLVPTSSHLSFEFQIQHIKRLH
nr:hypothetical protein [Vibrio parahaemolyticus]